MRRALVPLIPLAALACKSAPPPAPVEVPVKTATTSAAPAPAGEGATRRDALVETIFGQRVEDPYRWLEDEKSPEVRAWMKAADARARAHLDALDGRAALAARLTELHYVESRSAPVVRGTKLFFSRRPKDREKSIVYWQEGVKGAPEVLLDPNAMSASGAVSLGAWVPSWDGKLVAYLVKVNNADESTLRVMETETGRVLDGDDITGLRYTSPSWDAEGRGFYYTWLPTDPSIPPSERMGHGEIRYHRLGTDPMTDVVLREKTGDPQRWMGAWASKDGKYLFLSIRRGWAEQDLYVRFLKEREPTWVPIAVGTGALYDLATWKDVFYVATNHGAPRWKIHSVDPKKLGREHWKEVVPEHPTAVLETMAIVGGHLGLSYLDRASSRVEVRTLAGALVREVPLPSIGTSSGLYGREDDDTAYLSFSSYLVPEQIFSTSVKSGGATLFSKVDAPIDPSRFELEQVWYPSKDGTKVSMFVLSKKGLAKDGSARAVLYGYGGFNISMTPGWKPEIYTWLEQGGVWAIANLRGGGEYGEAWHQAGMLEKKQNVFDDFIAAAEHLVKSGYTSPSRLAISGRSNGGLLVGAVMTQRPELFGAVICGVPLLDMIRYPLVGIGKAWIPEYGDPAKEDAFAWLRAYSPYHNLKAGTVYPALLMTSVDSDDRVDPMHARKFVAAIEHAAAGARPKLLRIESSAGHSGGDMRKKSVELGVDELSFLLSELR
ncbi:prolyl oligopeptidase family serine peptidase [Myxococcota bacterium]|nr:prolyl oligopeptidase family serine peptidase [Myxococcota bacterium]